jgi:ABC-2 type transport system permease protein
MGLHHGKSAPGMTFDRAFLETWRTILTSRTLLSTMLLAVVLYAFYYPAPYSHETPRKLPVVVVDQDDSALSRAMILDLDATRAISVAEVVANLADAQADMRKGKADGVILISDGLERQLRSGTPGSGIAVWVNATYLLRASTIGETVTAVIQNTAKTHLLPGGQISRGGPPVAVVTEPLFNRTGGYKGYVFPSVAVIIIQQTLLFGAATFMGGRRRTGLWRMGAAEFGGTLAAFSSVGILGCYFLFGLIFWVQAVPMDGNVVGMMIVVPIFATAVAALGLLVGSVFDRSERAIYMLGPTSVPFFFLTGATYPLDQMPYFVAAFARLIPSTSGVHTFVPLNQMGATLGDVAVPLLTMVALAVVYSLLAYIRIVGSSPRSTLTSAP